MTVINSPTGLKMNPTLLSNKIFNKKRRTIAKLATTLLLMNHLKNQEALKLRCCSCSIIFPNSYFRITDRLVNKFQEPVSNFFQVHNIESVKKSFFY